MLLRPANAAEFRSSHRERFIRCYVQGLAYLQAHRGSETAAEFRKMISHRSLLENFALGALTRLQLARALSLARDRSSAQATNRDFLTLWRDADPDIPILRRRNQRR
jgi:hypothetical protein